jgi:5-methylcytosine-specific restriction enzyme B
MTIPTLGEIGLPLLRYAERGPFRNPDAEKHLAAEFGLTPEEIAERTPKDKPKFPNLIHWAAGDLNRAGLLVNHDDGYHITDRGREVLAAPPPIIDRKYLSRFTEHVADQNKHTSPNDPIAAAPDDLEADELEAEQVVPLAGAKDERSSNLTDMKPTNLILYGPPGTGKTFSTAAEAVRLCDGALPDGGDDAAIRRRYGELVKAGQVQFVTFHQSYAYEDFVEGLRPTTGEGEKATGGFRLEPVFGVFREIATLAEQARKAAAEGRRGDSFDLAGRQFWKMSLGAIGSEDQVYSAAVAGNYVALGWGGDVDWSDPRFADSEEMRKEWTTRHPEDKTPSQTDQPWVLRNKVRVRDLIIVPYGNSAFRAVAEVMGDYYFELSEEGNYNHRRKVRWLLTLEEPLPLDTIIGGNFTMRTLYQIHEERIRKEALTRLLSRPNEASGSKPPDQFVLIIDEINRANISKVFGELITLIEPDKRIGGEYELRATLPYSKVRFGVPDNLHIIGTMNTADRSIALLDTALRRRFEFRELMPQPEKLRTVDGLDLKLLLTTINERIEYSSTVNTRSGTASLCDAKAAPMSMT